MQSTIANDILTLSIDGQSKPQLLTKLILQVSVRELHNITEIAPE